MTLFVDWVQSNPEFLTGLVLGAFIVWILTYSKTLRTKLVEQTQQVEQLIQVRVQLAEQTQKVEQLLQARQAAKNRAKELDLSNHSNQIKFIEKAVLRSRKPITDESFRAVYAILEQSLMLGWHNGCTGYHAVSHNSSPGPLLRNSSELDLVG